MDIDRDEAVELRDFKNRIADLLSLYMGDRLDDATAFFDDVRFEMATLERRLKAQRERKETTTRDSGVGKGA